MQGPQHETQTLVLVLQGRSICEFAPLPCYQTAQLLEGGLEQKCCSGQQGDPHVGCPMR